MDKQPMARTPDCTPSVLPATHDERNMLSTIFDIARLKNRHGHSNPRFLGHRPSSQSHAQQTTDDNVVDNNDDFRLPRMRSLVTMLVASMLMHVRKEIVQYNFSPHQNIGHVLHCCLLIERIRKTSGWKLHLFRSCDWYSRSIRRYRARPNDEVRRW